MWCSNNIFWIKWLENSFLSRIEEKAFMWIWLKPFWDVPLGKNVSGSWNPWKCQRQGRHRQPLKRCILHLWLKESSSERRALFVESGFRGEGASQAPKITAELFFGGVGLYGKEQKEKILKADLADQWKIFCGVCCVPVRVSSNVMDRGIAFTAFG